MKYLKRAIVLFLILAMLPFTYPLAAQAVEMNERTVRVGYVDDNQFIGVNSNGNYVGYCVSYLNKLAGFTGWTYEYVQEDSWDELLDAVEDGEIDLVCMAQKTDGREDRFDFSDNYIDTEEVVVYTRQDADLYFQDYSHMEGLTVGLRRGTFQTEQFQEREKAIGFSCKEKKYDSDTELYEALVNGEVDLIAVESLTVFDDLKIVDRFGKKPFYFLSAKQNTEIMAPLNYAMEQLAATSPDLTDQLRETYYSEAQGDSALLLTRDEAEYIQSLTEPLRIGCTSNLHPLAYEDEETGEFSGIYVDLLERISEISGIEMEIEPLPAKSRPVELAATGDYDFIAGVLYGQVDEDNTDVQLTEGYFTRTFYLIERLDARNIDLEDATLSISSIFAEHPDMLEEGFSVGEMVACNSPIDGLDAVVNGQTDATVLSTYVANYYLEMPQYNDLTLTGVCAAQAEVCMAYPSDTDQLLLSVINKSIDCLAESEVNAITRQELSENSYEMTFPDVLSYYKTQLIAAAMALAVVIVLVIYIIRYRMEQKQQEREQDIYRAQMETDVLTGLPNREGFYRRGREFFAAHPDETAWIVFINVENFKLLNDLYGVAEGDKFLKYMGGLVQKYTEQCQAVCSRYEADHFVILTVSGLEAIRAHTDQLCKEVREYDLDVTMDFSVGVYEIMDQSRSLRLMIDRAHLAANGIKGNHFRQLAVYDDTHRQHLIQEQTIMNEMQGALESGQFRAYYQPKYNMQKDCVIGAEALVRWEHPEKGTLPPGAFVPVLEKNGFIGQLDLSMYEQTCEFLQRCEKEGVPLHPISVNLSRVGFYNPKLCETLCTIADTYGVPREYLELEVTETTYAQDTEKICTVLEELRQEGFKILMDDFGSGYSSLNMLKEVPIDEIKLDMRFLVGGDPYGRSENILRLIISMGNETNLSVLAEGVETEEQKEKLKSYHCYKAQGYYYAKPMDEESYFALLKEEMESLSGDQS